MFRTLSIPAIALCLSFASACGGPSYRTDVSFALRDAKTGPEVQALVARFYVASAAEWAPIEKETAALLRQYPHSAELHEVAGYQAILRDDSHGRWLHFLTAAADRTSPFTELYLSEAFLLQPTVGDANASIPILEDLAAHHPRSSVRDDATRNLVAILVRLGELDDAREAGKRAAFIRDFQIIGPFDNNQGKGFLSQYEVESKIDFAAEVRGLRTPVKWQQALIQRQGTVLPNHQIWPGPWSVGYLVTHVFVPTPTQGELRLTTSTSIKAWVNDAVVAEEEQITSDATDNVVVPVSLHAGWNRLLIKSANRADYWSVGAKVTKVGGAPIPGMRVSSKAQTYKAASATALTPTPDPVPETTLPEARRAFLRSRIWTARGNDIKSLAPAQSYVALAPTSPVALFFGALAYAANQQGGESIDLYDRGVAQLGDAGTALLRRRARYYEGKEQWDRAIADYKRAIAGNPNARGVRTDYASLLSDRGWLVERCAELKEVIARWPDAAGAHRELSDCLDDRGYDDAAEAELEKALELEPGSRWALDRSVDYATNRQDFAGAAAILERIAAFFPTDSYALVPLGDMRRRAGDRAGAVRAYTESLSLNPTWSVPFHRLGIMAQEDGDVAAAAKYWQRALAFDPSDKPLAEHLEFIQPGNADNFSPYGPTLKDIENAIASAASVKVSPDAHSVVLMDDEVRIVGADGSSRMLVTSIAKVANTDGRDELLKTQVPDTARVLLAYAQSPDGKRQDASSIRDGEIRFRGLDLGSIVVTQYVNHARAGGFLPNHVTATWSFQGLDQQFERSRWVVLLPPNRQLSLFLRGDVKHATEKKDGYIVHTFLAEHVPPLTKEPSMGTPADLVWTASISTLPNWDEYVSWERALLANVFESSDKLRALALKITDGAKTPHDKLDKLFAYVAQEIRYQQDYENTIAGVKPHSAASVLERGYGDCKDKATLLILLARELNIPVWFALVRVRGAGEVLRDVPNQQFNHAIAYVPPQEGIETGYFIDTTTDGLDVGNLRSDDQGTHSLVLDPTTGKFSFIDIPFDVPEKEGTSATVDVKVLGKNQMTASMELTLRGTLASSVRKGLRSEADAKQIYQSVASSYFPGSTVSEASAENADDIWKRLTLHETVDASASMQAQGDGFRLPLFAPFALSGVTQLPVRKTPVLLTVPDVLTSTLRYRLPPGARVKTRPDNMKVNHPCFTVARTIKVTGTTVESTYAVTRTCTSVAVADYPAFRAAAQKAANELKGELVVQLK